MPSGFGNEFQSESVAGALPVGRNSPQRPAMGLYAEQLSGTAFTAPRDHNRRSWLYRRRPSAMHPPYRPRAHDALGAPPFAGGVTTPNRLRWDPLPMSGAPIHWLDGLVTLCGNGSAGDGTGVAVHLYACNAPMDGLAFASGDGELLFVPQAGTLSITTEFGRMNVPPGHVALVPRGVRLRVDVAGPARGWCVENHGSPFRLPDLGPIGSNGLAAPRDFETPDAATGPDAPTRLVMKHAGRLWETDLLHTPFDVVAWHGNLVPWVYDLARFNTMGSVSFDHPDPSIFTVLTSPTDAAGIANCDFVIFPPRWMVAEDTFRPPWFHRNIMSEYMGLIHGDYDAKASGSGPGGGFVPGGGSLHNRMSAHGPDVASWARASAADLVPQKTAPGLAFMVETVRPFTLTPFGHEGPLCQTGYDAVWDGFAKGG